MWSADAWDDRIGKYNSQASALFAKTISVIFPNIKILYQSA